MLEHFRLVTTRMYKAVAVCKGSKKVKTPVAGFSQVNEKQYSIHHLDTTKRTYAPTPERETIYIYKRYGFILPTILEPKWLDAKVRFWESGNCLLLERVS